MNWEAIGTVIEIAGVVSVLATLIYLAKQIKDNSKLLATTIQDSAMQGYNEINQWAIGNPEIAALTHRMFVEDESKMTPLETFRVNMILRIYVNHNLKLYRLLKEGAYPVSEWEHAAREAKQVLFSTQIGRNFMRENHVYDDVWAAYNELDKKKVSQF